MLHPTAAAGLCTAANDNEAGEPARGVRTGILLALFCWLAFGAFLLGVLRP
jgi:hypothetical protein